MRLTDPLSRITAISMLATAVVTSLILLLSGPAEYWLVAGIWAISIGIHIRDRRLHKRINEAARHEGEVCGAAAEARRRAQAARCGSTDLPHAAD